MIIEPKLTVRVGEPHPGAIEALRVLVRILLREGLEPSPEKRLSVSARVCPTGRRTAS